jgi:signal transduction histidine kinase
MLIEGEQARVVRHLDRTDPAEAIRPVTGKSLPLTLPTLQSMLSSGKPLVISNTRLDALWRRVEQTTWIQSYAAAPLRVHGQIIGFLNMNSDQAGFFTQEIVPRLQAFADTAAAAIQNARLYQRVQHYAAELEDRVRERTAELSAAKERIEHILVSVPDAILVLDENRHLIHANPAGEALLVQAEQQGLDIFSPAFLAQLDSGGVPSERNVVQIQERSYQALASPMPFKGSKAAMVIVFRDVTRFRELDRMKTQFISDVSHELRTPLTNLSLYLDLLSATNDAERSQKYLSVLRRETQRLTHMIENLLTISRLETGRVDIHIAPVDVNRLVVDLAQDRKQMAANRDLSLTYVTHPDLPLALADPRLLMQVLSNLLTNALNYTPSGKSVQLQTELRQDDQGSLWVTVSVIDSGLGIRPEEMPYLFTRFFRGAAAQATNAPGTGLGLAISKEMMDHLGGRISVESQVGQGSTFTVWLKAAL